MLLLLLGCDVVDASTTTPADTHSESTSTLAQAAIPRTVAVLAKPTHTPNDSYLTRAKERYLARDFAGAIADYTSVLVAQPASVEAFVGRGKAYSAAGDFDRAIADL